MAGDEGEGGEEEEGRASAKFFTLSDPSTRVWCRDQLIVSALGRAQLDRIMHMYDLLDPCTPAMSCRRLSKRTIRTVSDDRDDPTDDADAPPSTTTTLVQIRMNLVGLVLLAVNESPPLSPRPRLPRRLEPLDGTGRLGGNVVRHTVL